MKEQILKAVRQQNGNWVSLIEFSPSEISDPELRAVWQTFKKSYVYLQNLYNKQRGNG